MRRAGGDTDLGTELLAAVGDVVEHHLAGTRFGIRVEGHGLVAQGADGWALTWMDACVDGVPVTARRGKPVEVNALWVDSLGHTAAIVRATGADPSRFEALAGAARASFRARFVRPLTVPASST